MGQAAVDLPDPLEQPSSAGSVGNADDLLSQLAGDEIDRLLAEAEVDPGTAAPVEVEPADPAPAVDGLPAQGASGIGAPAVPAPLPAALTPSVEPPVAPAPVPAAPEVSAASSLDDDSMLQDVLQSADATVQASLSSPPVAEGVVPADPPVAKAPDLFTALTTESAPAEPSFTANDLDQALSATAPSLLPRDADAPDVSADQALADAAPTVVKGVDFADGQTSLAERSALEEEDDASSSIDAITRQLDDVQTSEDGDALPLYLRPLEWLNAPFDSMSQPLREALGKVALITLINAVAVLLYVVIFR